MQAAGPISYKHIEVDPARRRVRVGTTDVDLTSNEFQLLYVLLSEPGHRVQPRSAAQQRVEGPDVRDGSKRGHAGQAAAQEDRDAIPRDPDVILTVWGAGYKAADV